MVLHYEEWKLLKKELCHLKKERQSCIDHGYQGEFVEDHIQFIERILDDHNRYSNHV